MLSLETRKYNIITQITALNNELAIRELEGFIQNITAQLFYPDVLKPMKEDLLISEMVNQQQYKGVNRSKFDTIIQDIDIKEPINELIAII